MTLVREVKQRLDIVDVVGQHVDLRQAGRAYKALCPFHAEKTPSFYVFPDSQTWRCFGACATGGDAFAFLMRQENLTFSEVLRRTASKAGISLPERRRGEEASSLQRLGEISEEALAFFHRLLNTSPEAEEAREYLKLRGVSQDSVDAFELGYSLKEGEALKNHLRRRGYEPEEIADAGLGIRLEDGRLRDRFRQRLMFPIRDQRGRLAGFGARALVPQVEPKYLNSPQTPLFDKGALLYGFHRAAGAIGDKETAVIVEGYLDGIIAHQHGFTNVVASMGTAITERQVGLLRPLVTRVVLALDPDAAGAEATLRSLEEAWDVFHRKSRPDRSAPTISSLRSRGEPDLFILTVPRGRDPDEFILESPYEWERLVTEAIPMLDYLLEAVAERADLTTDSGRTESLKLLMLLILRLHDVSKQDRYIQKLANLVDMDQTLLRRMLPGLLSRTGKTRERLLTEAVSPLFPGDPLEEYCVRLLLTYADLRDQAHSLRPDHFLHTENWELLQLLGPSRDSNELGTELDHPLEDHVKSLSARPLPHLTVKERQKALQDCLNRLEERRLRSLKAQEEQRFLAERQGDEDWQDRELLYQQAVELNRQLHQTLAERGG